MPGKQLLAAMATGCDRSVRGVCSRLPPPPPAVCARAPFFLLFVASFSPAADNYEETLSTLRYANRAKNIKNKPKSQWGAHTCVFFATKSDQIRCSCRAAMQFAHSLLLFIFVVALRSQRGSQRRYVA